MATVPVLQTAADLSASQIAGAASAIMPTGVVLPYAGSTAPAGWLLCNGQEISQSTYANLFAVISSGGVGLYDTQTNPLTGAAWAAPTAGNFRVPDYRGSFLRGVGTFTDGVGTDTSLGGYQADQMQAHRHDPNFNYIADPSATGAQWRLRNIANGPTTPDAIDFTYGADGANGNPRTGKETRVRNKGVNYIIKI